MYFIFGNYGDNTIAVIQWAFSQKLTPLTVINVDTKWGATLWQDRVEQGQILARRYGFDTMTLTPSFGFQDLVLDRKSFPTAKYQWCPTFLKALPLLSWLEEHDPQAIGILLLGSRRLDSRARYHLPEFIEESEHYGGRHVWYPLFNSSQEERDQLIKQAGFEVLNQRSLECAPCIHSSLNEIKRLDATKVEQVNQLEGAIKQCMFQSRYPEQPITKLVLEGAGSNGLNSFELSDGGCGSWYVCGE
jgi:hypothetical protein